MQTDRNQMATEEDTRWLIDELERYNRRPPWFSEPDFFDPVDPVFKGDDVVYLAYRGAKRRALGSTRFDGQANLRKKVQELDNASSIYKREVVTRLSNLISPELRKEVASWAEKPSRKKRRNKSMSPPSTEAASSTNDPPSTLETPDSYQPPYNATESRLTIAPPRPAKQTTPVFMPITIEKEQHPSQHSFSTTYVSKAQNILPDHLLRVLDNRYSIEQETFLAPIGMSYENADTSLLTLTILSEHIERIAKMIFNVQFQTIDGARYISHDTSDIEPHTITRCPISAVAPFLGETLNQAVLASPTFAKDSFERPNETRAVSIRISQNRSDVGVLLIKTNLFSCVNIWNTLGPTRQISSLEIARHRGSAPVRDAMPFTLEELDPTLTFDDAQPTPVWIVGKNQQIHWRRCFIRVYTTTNKQFAQANCEICDGQCTVPEGKELFLGGHDGYVKV
ncbi:hypothetical protein RRF57_013265 [Xylaria bambusicola]|uniref:Uncharacterized protein n=1 Tax=Xylaria bambusicola TaxID=326684 RepID=A0AAN7Z568_9PEZI